MSFSIRTLAFATLLIASVASWTSLSAYLWAWALLVFVAMAIFLASLEIDNAGSTSSGKANWVFLATTMLVAICWFALH